MELPCKEEDEEEVVSVPEPLEVGTAPFLHSKPNHDAKTGSHDPTRSTGTSSKVCPQKYKNALTRSLCIRVKHSEFLEVAHMCGNMDNREYNHRPCCRFMEGDIFVERDELIQGCPAKKRDEITTDGQKDEDNVGV